MTALPAFNFDGVLPPGDYPMTIDDLRQSHLVHGLKPAPTWDPQWRGRLVDHLEITVQELWQAGITEIFIDGSFVENKDHPHDIDGYFECNKQDFLSGNLEQRLNALSHDKIWTWDSKLREKSFSTGKDQLPMWHLRRVDLYPHYGQVAHKDEFGHELMFPSLFRTIRYLHREKGIVKIVRESVGAS